MHFMFIIGTAGSGKTMLTDTFSRWLRDMEENVVTLNLDSAVTRLPYSPDVDIRDWVRVDQVIEEYDLGPNGAIIAAADLAVGQIPNVNEAIDELGPDIVIVDTPGQMEVFAYRRSGPILMRDLVRGGSVITAFLLDPALCISPSGFVISADIALSGFPVPKISKKSPL